MKCLVELKVVGVKDYAHFLRNANTNHALWYYWSILDLLLEASDNTADFADVFSVGAERSVEGSASSRWRIWRRSRRTAPTWCPFWSSRCATTNRRWERERGVRGSSRRGRITGR